MPQLQFYLKYNKYKSKINQIGGNFVKCENRGAPIQVLSSGHNLIDIPREQKCVTHLVAPTAYAEVNRVVDNPILMGILYGVNSVDVCRSVGINYDAATQSEANYNALKNQCVDLTGFYKSAPYNDEKYSIITQGHGIDALKLIIKNLITENAKLDDSYKIKYVVFNAAGYPYDTDSGLLRYYTSLGFKLIMGVYVPFDEIPYHDNSAVVNLNMLTIDKIRGDYAGGFPRLRQLEQVYNANKQKSDVIRRAMPVGLTSLQQNEYMSGKMYNDAILSPLQALCIGEINTINDILDRKKNIIYTYDPVRDQYDY
jgi:hypothetical protein